MEQTVVRDDEVARACNQELMSHPDAAPPGPAPVERACVVEPEWWWPNAGEDPVAAFDGVSVSYGDNPAVRDVSFAAPRGSIVALIGPSGSGKSTLIRCVNRMNDLVPAARVDGRVLYRGVDLYAADIDAVQVRKRIGMVFQRPNPFPKSIFDNVAFGPRVLGFHGELDEIVERSLRRAAMWDEVKDRLQHNAYGLSGGQQQRLVIARSLAVEPDVLLMDEPASALDPNSTARIEDLMRELTPQITIIIVTHNLQQAGRVADHTAFLTTADSEGGFFGQLVEFGPTKDMFTNPRDARTEAYLSGRFG
jgi:phosphate transport system ATP-binding protein